MANDCGTHEMSKSCSCPHHKMTGIWIALIGLTILLGNLDVLSAHTVGLAWPALLTLAGLQKAFDKWCKCCR